MEITAVCSGNKAVSQAKSASKILLTSKLGFIVRLHIISSVLEIIKKHCTSCNCLYFYFYSLFNDAFSSSDYIASNERKIRE
jgi:hypothetical protein